MLITKEGGPLEDATDLVVQATTNSTRGTAVLVKECGEVSLAATNVVFNGSLVLALGEELDGRETSDAVLVGNRLVGLGIGVEISDHTLWN